MAPLDTPLLSDCEWQRRIEGALWAQAGVRANLDDFAGSWFAGRRPNTKMVAFARELGRRGFFVGMLSNMARSFEPHWRKIVPAELFDELVFSHRVRARKPESRIYEIAAASADRPGASCLLVDDLRQNCDGARTSGWSAVHFSAPRQAIAEVESLLSRQPL